MTGYQLEMQIRVDLGAALLDEKVPGWRTKVDLDIFELRSTEDCILGQVFGDYGVGTRELGLNREAQAAHGFDLKVEDYLSDEEYYLFSLLEDAWYMELKSKS